MCQYGSVRAENSLPKSNFLTNRQRAVTTSGEEIEGMNA
jgi:hypothetical protein